MTRTRVLFLTSYFDEGGGERMWVNLLSYLDRNRFEPSVVWFSARESHFLRDFPSGIPIFDLGRRRRFRYEVLRLLFELRRVCKRVRPHVVVSNLNEWNFLLFLVRMSLRIRFRIVSCEIGSISASLAIRQIPRWKKLAVSGLYRRVYGRADWIVPSSEGVASDLVQNFGTPRDRIRVIYLPVDLNTIRSRASEPVDHPWFSADVPVIVSVGRLIEHKDYGTLLRAFAKLRSRIDARLVLIGEGRERPMLESLVEELRVVDSVAFLGALDNPFKYVSRANVFALSSVSEGMSYVIVEALALGVPVVSTDCPSGPAEVLEYGRAGLLVPPRNPATLAAGLLRVLKDADLRQGFIERGTRRAQDFSIQETLRDYEEVLSR